MSAGLELRLGSWIEDSVALPDGDLVVSDLGGGTLRRIDADTGAVSLLARVPGPGGLAVRGGTVYVATGNSPASAVSRAGGVAAVDLATGRVRTVVAGLGQANGLAPLPGGDLALAVTFGPGAGVLRITPSGTTRQLTSSVPTANGLAVGPDGRIYVGSTVNGTVTRVEPDTGRTSPAGGISALIDDFSFLPDGRIVAATTLGQVDVIDPVRRTARPVAGGFGPATSATATSDTVVVTTTSGRVTSIPHP